MLSTIRKTEAENVKDVKQTAYHFTPYARKEAMKNKTQYSIFFL